MLDEKTRALLGDREAQEAFTARGELLGCPCCGSEVYVGEESDYEGHQEWISIYCIKCGLEMNGEKTPYGIDKEEVKKLIVKWNHRAPLLTPEQMEALKQC